MRAKMRKISGRRHERQARLAAHLGRAAIAAAGRTRHGRRGWEPYRIHAGPEPRGRMALVWRWRAIRLRPCHRLATAAGAYAMNTSYRIEVDLLGDVVITQRTVMSLE